ncbi:MAG TPA: DUF364 domain-containing protein [Methanoregulaceae archaeon]|nr:MAG: DUF364 domain-containing protein [Methanolinea sp.]HON81686.1 DUF364 domain-containing protein [Methanoregulaceae archaeon]HPD10508.1 DUF364 domain-containing protein [Methanoregulaceae archaeon]HRT15526.1 DUF364 domain-containing protein [Methanoregulaceae archaeon]HRU31085.1 DUF364 domain-containing protein [Methanoregulaceae archaeon]
MTILTDILATLPGDAPVRNVIVGAHWTMVCSRYCGLASTIAPSSPHMHHDAPVRNAGRLHKKSARELASYALSDNLLEAGIGIAAINSLLPIDEKNAVDINASQILAERGRGKSVALVGHFPFIPQLRKSVSTLWVIEQKPFGDDYPAHSAPDLIPKADVVALTGSALINHTLDDLLALCRADALVMVLGPSTPLSPVLFEYGAGIIAGSRVVDERCVMQFVSQGANFQQIEGVRKVALSAF